MPGDKSISHRAAMMAAIANGTSIIRNYATSADCANTLSCLQQLGVRIERDGAQLAIHGLGRQGFSQPDSDLDCGNSGTTMRLLAGILAGQNLVTTLTGDESLRSRPMQRIIEPLELMGATVSADDGRAPLRIHGRQALQPINYELLTASAQVKSCILLAALSAGGTTLVTENETTRDHTERMLRWFGAACTSGKWDHPANATYAGVSGPADLSARDLLVPGDISSAAYFIAAACLLCDSSLEIIDVGLNPTRIAFIEVLRRAGFKLEIANQREEGNEPIGNVRVYGQSLVRNSETAGFTIDGSIIPQLIDELPLLAVVGSQLEGGVEIRGAKELRVKESDRISTTVAGLRAMGCRVEEFDDGLRVNGPTKLRGASINSHGDHRIAMSFSIAGLVAESETEIVGADCVAVSFPEFFDLLQSVVER